MQLVVTPTGNTRFRTVMPLVDPGAKKAWVHVAYTGKFVYEGEKGELTRETFDSFIRNFEAQKNPMPVFLEHSIGPAEGWVHKLAVRGNDLHALVEFGEDAREWVQKGKYRYCSMGFDFNGVSRDTGEKIGPVMQELSLTNLPFLDGQQPIQFSRVRGRDKMPTPKQFANAKIKDLVDSVLEQVPGDVSVDQFVEALRGQAKVQSVADGEPAEPEMATDVPPVDEEDVTMQAPGEEATEELAAGAEILGLLMEMTGLGEAEALAAFRDNQDQIAALLTGDAAQSGTPAEMPMSQDANKEVTELRKKLSIAENRAVKLSQRLDKVEADTKARKQAEVEARVQDLVQSGRIAEDEREDATYMFSADPKRAERIYAKRQAVPMGEFAPVSGDSEQSASGTLEFSRLSSGDQNVVRSFMAHRGWSEEQALEKLKAAKARRADRRSN